MIDVMTPPGACLVPQASQGRRPAITAVRGRFAVAYARRQVQGLDGLVLASDPFYASGTFWAGAAVAVAVVALLVPIVLWFLGSPRRLLVYGVVSDTALLTSGAREQVGLGLKVTLNGQILNDPHVVRLQVESRSRRDIRGTDFENGTALTLDLGTPILNLLTVDTGGPEMPGIKVQIKSTMVAIGPGLIKKGQIISVSLLTDSPVLLTCPNPQIAEVIVRQRRPDFEVGLLPESAALVGALAAVIIGSIIDVFIGTRRNSSK
jgi:hypothetical protein